MIINIIIAALAYFLAGQFSIFKDPFTSFVFWAAILFFVAGAGYVYANPTERKRFIF